MLIDCVVCMWSSWSIPSKYGTIERYRIIVRKPYNGGKPCPKLRETKDGKNTKQNRATQVHSHITLRWWTLSGGGGKASTLKCDVIERYRIVVGNSYYCGKPCPRLREQEVVHGSNLTRNKFVDTKSLGTTWFQTHLSIKGWHINVF